MVQKEKVKAKGPQEEPPHSIIKNFPSPSTMVSTNPSGWFIKKEKKKRVGVGEKAKALLIHQRMFLKH